MSQSLSAQKRDKLHKQLSTAKKRQYFQQIRQGLLQARRNDQADLQMQFETKLAGMFPDQEEFEHVMGLFQAYEKDKEEYEAYIAEIEEQSMNFERIQRAEKIAAQQKRFREIFGDDD